MAQKVSFNKVVRSHEAAMGGLLLGVVIGVVCMINFPIHITSDTIGSVTKLCGTSTNIQDINFTYTGGVSKVVCKDLQVFTNFK